MKSPENQLVLNFDQSYTEGFETCRSFVADRVSKQHKQGRRYYQKEIAMDMDYSPSYLSRKMANGRDSVDTDRLTLDDFEQFIEVTGDTTPIYYLVEKFIGQAQSLERLKAEQERITKQILALQKAG